jgi:hypothetical protein
MNFSIIVAKITAFCTTFLAVFCALTVGVQADVVTRHQKTIEILSHQEVRFDHLIEIVNNTPGRVVNNYVLYIPYTNVTKIRTSEGNFRHQINYRKQRLSIALRKGLLFQQTSKVRVTYVVKESLKTVNGLLEFRLPQFEADETIEKFQTVLTFPGDFPELIFAQNKPDRQSNQLTFSEKAPIHLLWGKEGKLVLDDTLSLNVGGDKKVQQLVNLIPSNAAQAIRYRTLDSGQVLSEPNGNIWAILQGNLHYRAEIITQPARTSFGPVSQVNSTYPGLALPADVKQLAQAAKTQSERAQILYKHFTHTYIPTVGDVNSRQELAKQIDELSQPGGSNKLGMLLMTSTFAKWLAEAGIQSRVEYGFHIGADWPSFDERQPATWVSAQVDGTQVLYEPFLQLVTGYDFSTTPVLDRIKFGEWSIENLVDAALGLQGPGLRARPDIVVSEGVVAPTAPQVLGAEDRPLIVGITSPAHAFAGEAYEVLITLHNNTEEILQLAELSWDGADLSATLQSAGGKFTYAVAPHGSLEIRLDSPQWPTLIYEGRNKHAVKVEVARHPVIEADYSIYYTSRPEIQMGIGASILLFGLLVSLIGYRQLRLRQIKYLALQSI